MLISHTGMNKKLTEVKYLSVFSAVCSFSLDILAANHLKGFHSTIEVNNSLKSFQASGHCS